ncbi:nickel/cobalt efflux transporter RcnA [Dyella tabacisoli]|uniref:Nickel/cobalt efflux system n=1 Tax=Dyella tabacisoli TaxID=2282381 RepID=A0A369UTD4_9GAMM|nr:nickel/cobalt efflux transporter RcnA [Dyella tabacisoli]
MPDLVQLLSQGSSHLWLFIPTAILLGALHGLEPGHSKTMMAAFIIAIRGTATQAALLGLSAAFSHTLIVWLVALLGLYLGSRFDMNASEPYFQLASGVLIVCIALWILHRTWREHQHELAHAREHHHGHTHDHHAHAPSPVRSYAHAFTASSPLPTEGLVFTQPTSQPADYEDAHEREHARDIQRRFADRNVSTAQIVMFGLTGGLIPCPAAITVLLLCLQLKRISLGATLVISFSIGLALTMVLVGVAAAMGMNQAMRRWPSLGQWVRRAPYASSVLIVLIGFYVAWQGWVALH